MVLVNILFFVIGLVLLVVGSDFFVKYAAAIAKKLGISEFIIGLTLVALGTSIPELASAIVASIKHQSGLVIGNIVGANIANIGLITGLASIIVVIKTRKEMLKRDGYIMLLVAFIFYFFILDGSVSRFEAVVLLLLYLAYTMFLIDIESKLKGPYHLREFLDYFFKLRYLVTIRSRIISGVKIKDKNVKLTNIEGIKQLFREGLVMDFFMLVIAGFAIVFGARLFVNGAITIAGILNVPKTIIGVSLVSLGTTLPELSVTVAAARKGLGNIALGNIIGSNITNVLLIIGTAALINPLSIIKFTLIYAVPFMILMSILLLVFIRSEWKITVGEGVIFLGLYIFFLLSLFFKGLLF